MPPNQNFFYAGLLEIQYTGVYIKLQLKQKMSITDTSEEEHNIVKNGKLTLLQMAKIYITWAEAPTHPTFFQPKG